MKGVLKRWICLFINYLFMLSALCFEPGVIAASDQPGFDNMVWINEINVGDVIYDLNYSVMHGIWENAYIEIAAPAWMDLGGWKVDLVSGNNYVTHTIQIPYGLHSQAAVTNGYTFFVITDANLPYPQTPALPKVDFKYAGLKNLLPTILPGGIRLRRPEGVYVQAIAYDDAKWNENGGSFDGNVWAAGDPEGCFVYVGADGANGSLSRVGFDDNVNSWVYPLFPEWDKNHQNFARNYTPGLPNGLQWLPNGDQLNLRVLNSVVSNLSSASYSGGSGAATDPYQIATKADLLCLGTNTAHYSKHFIMTADIDLTGEVFTNAVIAADADPAAYGYQGSAFGGVFDGNGHVVSNLLIDTDGVSNDYLGLFGYLSNSDAVIRNLGVKQLSIHCGASEYVGGVCAYIYQGTVDACATSGSISCGVNADSVGGLCGINAQGVVKESSSSVSLSVSGNASRFGGLSGFNYYGMISNSYASGAVISSGYYMGGLCGEIFGGVIVNSYSSGVVSGVGYAGGFIGLNYYGGNVDGCFWDTDASGCLSSDGGTGVSSEEINSQSFLLAAGWDFVIESANGIDDCWYMDGYGYPKLAAQNREGGFFRLDIDGRGEVFVSEGLIVDLEAEPAQVGWFFDRWVVQPATFSNSVENIFSSSAIFTMPATNIILNASYQIRRYPVTFDLAGHGIRSGGGQLAQIVEYAGDAVAPVVAADAHWVFDGWDAPFTNITADLIVTALYLAKEYELYVLNGTGSGIYTNQAVVDISADAPMELQGFSHWMIEPEKYTNCVQDIFAPDTTISIPGTNLIVTAVYWSSFEGGTGFEDDPWQIGNNEQFMFLATNSTYYNRHFMLTHDIDLQGMNFDSAVIGPDTDNTMNGFQGIPFTGVFDGNGYVISNFNVNAGASGNDYLGVFGKIEGVTCQIRNLGVEDFFVMGGDFSFFVGGLCGLSVGAAVDRCYVDGSLAGAGMYLWYIGGLCGYNSGGVINQCYSSGSVTGGRESDYLGGLCGYNDGAISQCYSAAYVSADTFSYYTGGFCGRDASSEINACFWDTQSSGYTTSAGGTGLTTAEMQSESTFIAAAWDFTDLWHMDGYPALRCFTPADTYAYWLINAGIPAGLRAETDDPAEDCIPNLLKYACGLPAMEVVTTADLMMITPDGANTFSVLYYKSRSAQDVLLQPVWAETLSGPWNTVGIAAEWMGEDAERELWKASIPLGGSGFIRLRATRQD